MRRRKGGGDGTISAIVSGVAMSYSGAATRMRSETSSRRSTSVCVSDVRTTRFQPSGSDCADLSPESSARVGALSAAPTSADHWSPDSVSRSSEPPRTCASVELPSSAPERRTSPRSARMTRPEADMSATISRRETSADAGTCSAQGRNHMRECH